MVDVAETRALLLSDAADGQATGSYTPQRMRNLIVSLVGPPAVLTPSSGAVTWNLATAPCATVTITAATTVTVTNGEDGMSYRLAIIQGGAGNFTPTLSGVTQSSTPVWSTAAGSSNRVYIDVVGSVRMADII